jgi:hypothetical protein
MTVTRKRKNIDYTPTPLGTIEVVPDFLPPAGNIKPRRTNRSQAPLANRAKKAVGLPSKKA